MKKYILPLASLLALAPGSAQAAYSPGEMGEWKHPWGYDAIVIERGYNEYDTLVIDGPEGIEAIDVHCRKKDWESFGYNSDVSDFQDAAYRSWCSNFL